MTCLAVLANQARLSIDSLIGRLLYSTTSLALVLHYLSTSLALFLIGRIPNFIIIFATLRTDKSHDASHVTSAYYILHHYSRTNSALVLHYNLQFACYFYQLLPFLHHLYLGAQNKTYILVWCYVCVMSISPFFILVWHGHLHSVVLPLRFPSLLNPNLF